MEKIIITATAESIEQVKQLLEAGVDRIYVGEKDFGLRLPTTFSHDQLREIAKLVHDAGKELIVAVNALMHQDMMGKYQAFPRFLGRNQDRLYYDWGCRCFLRSQPRWLFL